MTKAMESEIEKVKDDPEKLMALKDKIDDVNSFRSVQQSEMDISYGLIKLRVFNGLIQLIKTELHRRGGKSDG